MDLNHKLNKKFWEELNFYIPYTTNNVNFTNSAFNESDVY
jgi:hypothetical protein